MLNKIGPIYTYSNNMESFVFKIHVVFFLSKNKKMLAKASVINSYA